MGKVLPNCSIIDNPGRCELWAPDVNFVNGSYALYYSVSSLGSQNSAIGVATSPSMEPGTWTDLGQVISSKSGDLYNASACAALARAAADNAMAQSTRISSITTD